MSTNYDLLECPNTKNRDWKCPKSDVIISRETDTVYVLFCRTCRCTNVITKKVADQAGAFKAKLMAQAREQEKDEELRRKRTYSFGGS